MVMSLWPRFLAHPVDVGKFGVWQNVRTVCFSTSNATLTSATDFGIKFGTQTYMLPL